MSSSGAFPRKTLGRHQGAKKRPPQILLKNSLDAPEGREYNPPPLTNGAAERAAREDRPKGWMAVGVLSRTGSLKTG